MTQKAKKGFTLIELMIVVAIIGILAAIAIPNFIKFQAKGKQAEANANLKAIFTAQKANFPILGGFWSDIGSIGFSPERGNRYFYDLGATAPTVDMGTVAVCALANFQMRDTVLTVSGAAGDCGVGVDSFRHGAQFADATINGLVTMGTVALTMENTNADLGAAPGVNGAACPACDFAARAKSNVDNDAVADEWWISSQSITTANAPNGCAPGRMYSSGSPAVSNDDVCAE